MNGFILNGRTFVPENSVLFINIEKRNLEFRIGFRYQRIQYETIQSVTNFKLDNDGYKHD